MKTTVENLDVILSGPAPPNASELILSRQMPELLDYSRKNYDYVLIDTPPMGLTSDAQVLMKYSDINLFIINTKQGSMDSLQFAHNSVANNKAGSFAFILNNVNQKKSRYYYKNYTYGYGDTGYLQES
jgi:capsular exopolysaccharide synthesis family protein